MSPNGLVHFLYFFENFVTFLHWVIGHKSGISTLDHYLDDFLFARAALSNDCKIMMDTFHSVSRDLGGPLPENKTEGPTTHLTYLGLNIDTVEMKVKMSTAKLDQLCIGIRFIMSHMQIKLRDLESIGGIIVVCARAIPSGRAF